MSCPRAAAGNSAENSTPPGGIQAGDVRLHHGQFDHRSGKIGSVEDPQGATVQVVKVIHVHPLLEDHGWHRLQQ